MPQNLKNRGQYKNDEKIVISYLWSKCTLCTMSTLCIFLFALFCGYLARGDLGGRCRPTGGILKFAEWEVREFQDRLTCNESFSAEVDNFKRKISTRHGGKFYFSTGLIGRSWDSIVSKARHIYSYGYSSDIQKKNLAVQMSKYTE